MQYTGIGSGVLKKSGIKQPSRRENTLEDFENNEHIIQNEMDQQNQHNNNSGHTPGGNEDEDNFNGQEDQA